LVRDGAQTVCWWPFPLMMSMASHLRTMKPASQATTRFVGAPAGASNRQPPHFSPSEVIRSPETRLQYQVERLLGVGGFGQVYLSRRLDRSTVVPDIVCIKASHRLDGWLREAYFGQLLDGHPRAIGLFDAFPLMRRDGRILYCLALEYARHGDLSD